MITTFLAPLLKGPIDTLAKGEFDTQSNQFSDLVFELAVPGVVEPSTSQQYLAHLASAETQLPVSVAIIAGNQKWSAPDVRTADNPVPVLAGRQVGQDSDIGTENIPPVKIQITNMPHKEVDTRGPIIPHYPESPVHNLTNEKPLTERRSDLSSSRDVKTYERLDKSTESPHESAMRKSDNSVKVEPAGTLEHPLQIQQKIQDYIVKVPLKFSPDIEELETTEKYPVIGAADSPPPAKEWSSEQRTQPEIEFVKPRNTSVSLPEPGRRAPPAAISETSPEIEMFSIEKSQHADTLNVQKTKKSVSQHPDNDNQFSPVQKHMLNTVVSSAPTKPVSISIDQLPLVNPSKKLRNDPRISNPDNYVSIAPEMPKSAIVPDEQSPPAAELKILSVAPMVFETAPNGSDGSVQIRQEILAPVPTTDRMPVNGTNHFQSSPFPPETGPRVATAIAQAAVSLQDHPVELILNPEELGRVRLTLQAGDGVMAVAVAVERPETLDLLRRHIDLLADQLREIGYEKISFDFANDSNPGGKEKKEKDANPDVKKQQLGAQKQDDLQSVKIDMTSVAGIDIRL